MDAPEEIIIVYLSNEVDDILHHGLKYVHSFAGSCSSAADADCKAGPEPHVGVE